MERRVEFRDTDAAGIVHFSAFFPMMEAAEHELMRSLGISILPSAVFSGDEGADPPLTWPRVAAHCDYVSAARFEDLLQIHVGVAKIGSSSVQFAFAFTRDDQPIANGTMTAVCCRLWKDKSDGETRLEKSAIPAAVRSLLGEHSIESGS